MDDWMIKWINIDLKSGCFEMWFILIIYVYICFSLYIVNKNKLFFNEKIFLDICLMIVL